MDVIDCIWSIAPSTYTGTSELNHLPKELVPSQGFQVAVPRLELTPRLLLQLGQLLQVPLSCWPGPVRVSPYSVTASSWHLNCHSHHSQLPASSSTDSGKDQEPWLLPAHRDPDRLSTEVESFLVMHTVVPATTGPS